MQVQKVLIFTFFSKDNEEITITVHNILGGLHLKETIQVKANAYNFFKLQNTYNIAGGIYLVSINTLEKNTSKFSSIKMKSSADRILTPIVIVAALGYFVDIYDLVLFGMERTNSLKEIFLLFTTYHKKLLMPSN